jgi:hypothetical protein
MATWLGLELPARITVGVVVTIFGLVLLLWLLTPIVMLLLFRELAERGQAGDLFGSINALFSGLAFAGVIIAILLQREELALQREELKYTREELRRSATAQEQLWEASKHAAKMAETTVSKVEGAWIFASPIQVMASPSKWKIEVKNHGKTPGLITGYHLEFWDKAPQGNKANYIGPIDEAKAVWTCGTVDRIWALPWEFEGDQGKQFAVGFVRYLDAFNKTKTTHFCYDISDSSVIRPAGSTAYNSFHSEDS